MFLPSAFQGCDPELMLTNRDLLRLGALSFQNIYLENMLEPC